MYLINFYVLYTYLSLSVGRIQIRCLPVVQILFVNQGSILFLFRVLLYKRLDTCVSLVLDKGLWQTKRVQPNKSSLSTIIVATTSDNNAKNYNYDHHGRPVTIPLNEWMFVYWGMGVIFGIEKSVGHSILSPSDANAQKLCEKMMSVTGPSRNTKRNI